MTIIAKEVPWPFTNLENELWNQLAYDCCCSHFPYATTAFEKQDWETMVTCTNASKPLWKLMMPLVEDLLELIYMQSVKYLESNPNLLMENMCDMYDFEVSNAIRTLIWINSANHNETIDDRVDRLIFEYFAYQFRQWPYLSPAYLETKGDYFHYFDSYEDCLQVHENNFTLEAKSAFIFMRLLQKTLTVASFLCLDWSGITYVTMV